MVFQKYDNNHECVAVLWDFSQYSYYALKHAIIITQSIQKPINFIHVCKKNSQIDVIKEKINSIAAEFHNNYGIKYKVTVGCGKLIPTLKTIVNNCNPYITVMGIHDLTVKQLIFGCLALKIIRHSDVPILTCQGDINYFNAKKIVLPFGHKIEERKKLSWAKIFASHITCKFFACYQDSPNIVKNRKIIGNLKLLKSFFSNNNINYDIVKIPDNTPKFVEIKKIAKANNAGLILIYIKNKKNILIPYTYDSYERNIIFNEEKIPVLCLNPNKIF